MAAKRKWTAINEEMKIAAVNAIAACQSSAGGTIATSCAFSSYAAKSVNRQQSSPEPVGKELAKCPSNRFYSVLISI